MQRISACQIKNVETRLYASALCYTRPYSFQNLGCGTVGSYYVKDNSFLTTGIEYKYSYLFHKVYNESVFLVFGYGKCIDSEGENLRPNRKRTINDILVSVITTPFLEAQTITATKYYRHLLHLHKPIKYICCTISFILSRTFTEYYYY